MYLIEGVLVNISCIALIDRACYTILLYAAVL